MEIIVDYLDGEKYHKVFTNSVRYNETVKKYIDDGKISITTSVDAGSEELFKRIRGRDKYNNVFENLKNIPQISPNELL